MNEYKGFWAEMVRLDDGARRIKRYREKHAPPLVMKAPEPEPYIPLKKGLRKSPKSTLGFDTKYHGF